MRFAGSAMHKSLSPHDLARARLRLLQMHFEAGVGHIGGNLSALDLLMVVHHELMRPGDAFVLSKGHSAGALYVTLWTLGRLDDEALKTFHRDDTLLAAHPPPAGLADVLFATGSLGHGLPLSCGLALSRKLRGEAGRVWCLMSDGEWNEGSNWEALIFARQQGLANLTVIVDLNGLQGFGTTAEVADLRPLATKLRDFGWEVEEVDGHDAAAVAAAGRRAGAAPRAILATTTKGRGVSFMEDRMEWHYLPLTPALYEQAVREVRAAADIPTITAG
jgi:transketolase